MKKLRMKRFKKPYVLSVLIMVSTLLCASAANATPILDQSSDATGGSASYAVYSYQSIAQTFTAGTTGTLSMVSLMLNRTSTSTGSFVLNILSAGSGAPDSTSIYSQSFDVSALSVGSFSYTYTDFDVSSGNVNLIAGQQYAIALTYAYSNSYSDWLTWDSKSGNPYAAGGEYSSTNGGSTWGSIDGYDAGFRTFVQTNSVPEPTSLALLGIGLVGLGVSRKRKYKA